MEEIWLFDFDTLSDHNLNRIPLPESAVGTRKSVAVAELMIRPVRPKCRVIPFGRFTSQVAGEINLKVDWIIATTDTAASRRTVEQWAITNGVKYIEAAAEGEQGSATGIPADWSTPDETNPGYASVPVWIGPCVLSAAVAVAHVLHNTPMGDRTVRLGWDTAGFGIFDSANEPQKKNEASHGV